MINTLYKRPVGNQINAFFQTMLLNTIRAFLIIVAVSIWQGSILQIPGIMTASGEEDTEDVLLTPATEARQCFMLGKVAKLVYHIRYHVINSPGFDRAITYVPQDKLGKKCSYGYTFYDLGADMTLLSGFYVACKKEKNIYIVYSIFSNPDKRISVDVEEYKLGNYTVYGKSPDGGYSTPWDFCILDTRDINEMKWKISSFEMDANNVKRMKSFARFIAKAFSDKGEVGVNHAINKSKKYYFSDESED